MMLWRQDRVPRRVARGLRQSRLLLGATRRRHRAVAAGGAFTECGWEWVVSVVAALRARVPGVALPNNQLERTRPAHAGFPSCASARCFPESKNERVLIFASRWSYLARYSASSS